MITIVGSRSREKNGDVLVLIWWLAPHTLWHLVFITFWMIVGLRHNVTNLRLIWPIQLYHIPLVIFMVKCILGFKTRRGIGGLVVVRLVTCSGIILLVLYLERIRFLLLLFQALHQRVQLLVSALVKIAFMILPLFINLRHPRIFLLIHWNTFLVKYII